MKRLPFHFLMTKAIDVLSTEISTSSLPHLLPLARVFDIEADQFYIFIINQNVEKLKNTENRDSIAITFADFKALIGKIRGHEKAVTTAVYVAGRFPCGEDRIAAYKMAQHFTERWVQSFSNVEVHFHIM